MIGPEDGTPRVLVAGLGEQIGSVEYPDEQVAICVEYGFRVVRLDNRASAPDEERRRVLRHAGAGLRPA